jgi:hypothetical protein
MHRTTLTDHKRLAFIWKSGTPNTWRIIYYSAYDTVGTALATLPEAGSGVTMDTNWHEFELRVTPGVSSTAHFQGFVDGVEVAAAIGVDPTAAFSSSYSAPGVQAFLNTAAITSALIVPLTGFDYASFDDIEYDSMIVTTGEPVPELEADPVLTDVWPVTETSGLLDTLPVTPDNAEIVEEVHQTSAAETEAGYVATFAGKTHSRRVWRVTHQTLTLAERDSLIEFLEDHSITGAIAFTFNESFEGFDNIKAFFIDGTLETVWLAPNVHSVEFSIMELF